MKKLILGAFLLYAYGCSSDDTTSPRGDASAHAGSGGASGEAGSHAGSGGTSGEAGSHAGGDSNAAGAHDEPEGGMGGEPFGGAAGTAEGGGAGSPSGSAGEGGSDDQLGLGRCAVEHAQALGVVDSVSTGDVTVVGTTAGVTTVYVGATAGGTAAAAVNPWIYVSLGGSSKAVLTDVTAASSTAWDLALKRPLLYTNSGEGGPGLGGAVLIAKTFEAVTAADAIDVTFSTEKFLDATCTTLLDASGAVLTSFATWYDYDPTTHGLSPHPGTWLVHGASGALFKLRIKSYYGTPTGAVGTAGGAYLLEVAAL
ncbi:MAG: HmuY family protein [Polyangiaceae bacterium]